MSLPPELHDEIMQKAEWRARIVVAIANREFERDTLIALVQAGFDQAHSEGLQDAAAVCHGVAQAQNGEHLRDRKLVATVLGNKIMDLDKLNRATTAPQAGDRG